MTNDALNLAQDVVQQALQQGAGGAECTLVEGQEFGVQVRMGEVEQLKQAGSRAIGLRVLQGRRVGSAYSSDLTPQGIALLLRSALELANISTEDPHAGLPESGELGQLPGDLQLYSPDVETLAAEEKIDRARRAEQAALQADPRITNSEGGSFDSYTGQRVFVNSLGFAGSYQTSSCSLSAVPVARTESGGLERDFWFTVGRSPQALDAPEEVGRIAAERVLRRLGARKVATQRCPVVFDPRVARTLLDHIFEAVSGSSIYRQESFLADKIGQRIASEQVTVVDDGTLPGLFGTSPFDDEGVPSRRTVVIERGLLQSYLLNSYTARKLGLRTTGNASRGITGNAGVGHGNLFLEPGTQTPQELLRGIRSGLYVTELLGQGVNVVTGDYSRGAAGLWIENGELAYPVSEITIASTLQEMLLGISAIANDLSFRGSVACPTLLLQEMTVSGV